MIKADRPLHILHIRDQASSPAEAGGVAIAREHYIAAGRRLGHRVETMTLDALLDAPDPVAPLGGGHHDLVHLHHVEHRLSASLLSRLIDAVPVLSTAYDVSGLCLTRRKVVRDTEFCEAPLGPPCVEAHCPLTPAWGPPSPPQTLATGDGLQEKLARLSALRRARVLVHSEYMARQFRLNGFLDERLLRVLPGVEIPLAEEPLYGKKSDRPRRLLFAGRLDRNKGVHLLPELVALLSGHGLDIELEIAGDGFDRESLEAAIHGAGIEQRVRLLGHLDRQRLIERYDQADLLLLPSMVPESFCLVGVEALSRALPVVAFAAGAIEDWMQDGVTGLLVKPGDIDAMAAAVRRLLTSPDLLDACRHGAWRRARELFGSQRVDQQLERAYRRTVKNARHHEKGRSLEQAKEEFKAPKERSDSVRWLQPRGDGRVLVIAPHFDDEVFGCGGAVARHRAAGDEVKVLFLTDGRIGGAQGYEPGRKQALRMEESRRALALLDVDQLEALDFADGQLSSDQDALSQAIRRELDSWRPTRLYAPHAGEWLPDHAAAATATRTALAELDPATRPDLLEYEIWTPLGHVDAAIDISLTLERKRQAILEFRSQLAEFDYEEAILALARFRGRALAPAFSKHEGPAIEAAEAFRFAAIDDALTRGHDPAQAPGRSPDPVRPRRIRLDPRRRPGRRMVVFSESPNAPTGFGQVVRHTVGALARRFDLDLVLLVPHLWPGDFDEDFEICPLGDEQHFRAVIERLDFDHFFMIKDTYGHGYVADALRHIRRSGKAFTSVLYTPIEGELCHRHLSGLGAFDHIVLYNDFAVRMLCRFDQRLGERCHIVPHGVDTAGCHPFDDAARDAARRRFLPAHVVDEGRFTLLNINRNYQRKDLPRTLHVLAEVLCAEPEVYLHLHTNPFEGDFELLEIARYLGLTARNLGFTQQHLGRGSQPSGARAMSAADITRLYNCADLVISTSVGEGHGFSTTEAMACGVPFLGPDNTAFRDLLGEGRGFLAPLAETTDAITYHAYTEPLPRRPVSVSAMAEMIVKIVRGELDTGARKMAALDHVRELAWPRVRESWFELFDQILAGARS